jgi:hypothetical protein
VRELYRSDRYFKVWQYTVSHRRLLLRSSRDRPPATRIDIHMGGIGLMVLRPFYEGLLIREGTNEERALVAEQYSVEVDPGTLFTFGPDLTSFVVGSRPQWHEDEGDSRTPSYFGHMIGTE